MTLFFAVGLDQAPSAAKRDALRAGHRKYIKDNAQPIVMAGVLLDDANTQCGSLYCFDVNDEAEVSAWLEREPFCAGGVYKDMIIRRFVLGQNRIPHKDWPVDMAKGLVGQQAPGASRLFVFLGLDHPPHRAARRDALRPEHRTYVRQNREPMALAVAVLDKDDNQCASFNVFEAASADAVRAWRAQEPFHKDGGVYKDEFVFRLELGHNRLPHKDWPANV